MFKYISVDQYRLVLHTTETACSGMDSPFAAMFSTDTWSRRDFCHAFVY